MTNEPTDNKEPTENDVTPSGHWSDDPAEVDRTLEGQLPDDLQAARRAEIAGEPALRDRMARREEFLAALAFAGESWRASLPGQVPGGLEARVRKALLVGAPTTNHMLRWATVAAALLVITLGASFWFDGGSQAEAMPPEVLKAIDAARSSAEGPRTCTDEGETSPKRFPPVRDGALKVWRCVHDERGTVAKLYRPEDLPSIGYVAVAEHGAGRGPDIGMTDLGDMVVFDVAYGSQRHYLAVRGAWFEHQERVTPGRASCVACHNRSRDGKANPHSIVKRSWELR